MRRATGLSQPINHLTDCTFHQSRLAAIWQPFFKYSRRPVPLSDERGRPVNQIEQTQMELTLPGSPSRLKPPSGGPVGSQRWGWAGWHRTGLFSASFLIVQWPERARGTHVQHMFPCTNGMTGCRLQPKHSGSCDTNSTPKRSPFLCFSFVPRILYSP